MENRYSDADAARFVSTRANGVNEVLAIRTYTARLLGAEPALVLHGGGNTSVKSEAQTLFGETVSILHVKGSGSDLATIEPAGHPAVRMTALHQMLALPELSDERMLNALRLALLDASAPTPSVETLLHASLPARFIDHTHADAILALADQARGEALCRDIFGLALLWVPYVMPGFNLAKACKRAWDAAITKGHAPTVMVLERHGIFTFGDTAKESYGRMIDACTRAEGAFAKSASPPALERESTLSVALDDDLEARVATVLRGALAGASGEAMERGPIVTCRVSGPILSFLERIDAYELVQRGAATPDHVIRTKPTALLLPTCDLHDPLALFLLIEREIGAYARRYNHYFDEMCAKKSVNPQRLDPWPRVVLVPGVGLLAAGKSKIDAEIAADLYEHTIQVMVDAESIGAYSPVSMSDFFDVEYWSLEQAKLKKEQRLALGGQVALVTGAASGIGRATASLFIELGAHVVAVDKDGDALDSCAQAIAGKKRSQLVTCVADVTSREEVETAFTLACRVFGGVDIAVSNAGTAPEGRLDSAIGDEALRQSLDTNLLAHNLVASCAVEKMLWARRGGVLLFNASKSAFNPGPGFGPYAVAKAALLGLMRQYAVDLGQFGIRSNAVNADRVRTGIYAGGVLESRAAARGLSVDDYFRSNLLSREATTGDVASAFAYLAQAQATTGCVITVDGGNAAAFPR